MSGSDYEPSRGNGSMNPALEHMIRRIEEEQTRQSARQQQHEENDRRDFSAMREDLKQAVHDVGVKIDRWGDETISMKIADARADGIEEGIQRARTPSPTILAFMQGAAGQVVAIIAAVLIAIVGTVWTKDEMDARSHSTAPVDMQRPLAPP